MHVFSSHQSERINTAMLTSDYSSIEGIVQEEMGQLTSTTSTHHKPLLSPKKQYLTLVRATFQLLSGDLETCNEALDTIIGVKDIQPEVSICNTFIRNGGVKYVYVYGYTCMFLYVYLYGYTHMFININIYYKITCYYPSYLEIICLLYIYVSATSICLLDMYTILY